MDERDQELEELRQENKELRELLKAALERIKELEDQVKQNSRNSNWPSSRDKDRKKKRKPNLRSKSDKKAGGQPGHKGQTLEYEANPDQVIVHRPQKCDHCAEGLSEGQASEGDKRRQVIDLPPLKVEVTEHRVEQVVCPKCGQENEGQFPEDVTKVFWTQYPNTFAVVTH